MASWLQLFTNPHRLAALLLSIATCLLTLTLLPPSSAIYLIRADYTLTPGDAVTSTTWIGNFGYCTSDAADDVLNPKHSPIKCSPAIIHGYNIEDALTTTNQTAPSSSPNLSIILTRGASILNPLAAALMLLSISAYRSILRRPRGAKYAVSMGASFFAFLLCGVGFVFEHSLQAYVSIDANAIVSTGPAYHAVVASLLVQLAASVVGFYSCIGGKYVCEREEGEESGGLLMANVDSEEGVGVGGCDDEKCPL